MPYNESHSELREHPKTKRLKRSLGVSLPAAIGHLQCLWWWVMDYAPKGDLTGFEATDIAEGAEWDGDPDVFVDALCACGPAGSDGFLERTTDGRLLVHDWWQYGGKLIVKRFVDAFRKRNNRVPSQAERVAANLPIPPPDAVIEDEESVPTRRETDAAPRSRVRTSETSSASVSPPSDVATTAPVTERSVTEQSITEQSVSVEQQQQNRAERSGAERTPRARDATPEVATSDGERTPVVVAILPDGKGSGIIVPGSPPQDRLAKELAALGVNRADAERLALTRPDECRKQLDCLSLRKITQNVAGFLRDAIEKGYELPSMPPDGENRGDSSAPPKPAQRENARSANVVTAPQEWHDRRNRDRLVLPPGADAVSIAFHPDAGFVDPFAAARESIPERINL